MNFTKMVKLTKTPITCHYRGWNSFSCDHFKKSRKWLESGFPDQYFWSCMLDCRDTFWTVFIAYCNACSIQAWDLRADILSTSWLAARSLQSKTPQWQAGVTGDMVPSADPVLGTKPAGGSRSHWRIWFWQEPHPPFGIRRTRLQTALQCTCALR